MCCETKITEHNEMAKRVMYRALNNREVVVKPINLCSDMAVSELQAKLMYEQQDPFPARKELSVGFLERMESHAKHELMKFINSRDKQAKYGFKFKGDFSNRLILELTNVKVTR